MAVHKIYWIYVKLTLLPKLFEPFYIQQQGELLVFIITKFYGKSCIYNPNSVDPDQMHHSAVSGLGLHCLPIILLGVPPTKMGYKWLLIKGVCFDANITTLIMTLRGALL